MTQNYLTNIELLTKAISFAARAHKDQFRKDKRTPYASHVFRVSMVLRHVFGVADEKVLAAAVLHDTIEDTTTDFDDVDKHFGREIAKWVGALSKDKRLPQEEREKSYRLRLQKAPEAVKFIKLADLYDNILDSSTSHVHDQLSDTLEKAKLHIQNLKKRSTPKLSKAVRIVEELIEEKSNK